MMNRALDFFFQYIFTILFVWGINVACESWFGWESHFGPQSFIVIFVVVAIIQYFRGRMFSSESDETEEPNTLATNLLGEEELMDTAATMTINDEQNPSGTLTDINPLD